MHDDFVKSQGKRAPSSTTSVLTWTRMKMRVPKISRSNLSSQEELGDNSREIVLIQVRQFLRQ